MRREIEESFNKISELRLEPKLLSDPGQHEPLLASNVEERGIICCCFLLGQFKLPILKKIIERVDYLL